LASLFALGFGSKQALWFVGAQLYSLRPAMSILVKDAVPNVFAQRMQLIAAEIGEDLQVALEQFAEITADLKPAERRKAMSSGK
jgi:hypothetical protein